MASAPGANPSTCSTTSSMSSTSSRSTCGCRGPGVPAAPDGAQRSDPQGVSVMKLAVMQPYLFPYLGYFQLIHAVDLFVIYDDVAFIKQGYINRNSILSRGQPLRFTLPVPGASSNRKICELHYAEDAGKLLKTVAQSYARAPHVLRAGAPCGPCAAH